MKKRLVAILLAVATTMSLVACNGGTPSSEVVSGQTGSETTKEYELTSIKMVVDGTLTANLDNRQDAFVEQWQEAIKEKTGKDVIPGASVL